MPQYEDNISELLAQEQPERQNGQQEIMPELREQNSEEVQDIMSKMPHWLIRRGITLLFAVMILLFAGAYFIRYPDVIVTQVTINSGNPPVKLVAPASGKIQQLFVQNNQHVITGTPICMLENPARYADVAYVKNLLQRIDSSTALRITMQDLSPEKTLQLGTLQSGYTDMLQAIRQYQFFVQQRFISQKVGQLKTQLDYQARLNEELRQRDALLHQQLQLQRRKYGADSMLASEKVIAPLEFDNSRKELLGKQLDADATRSSILQNQLQQAEYMKNITELQQQQLQQEYDLLQKVAEQAQRLLGLVNAWEQQFLVKSPVDGTTNFFKFWKDNQYVMTGEALFMIVPPIQEYVARAALPLQGAGKVKPGQKVLIRLSAYPFEEFGMLHGHIDAVSAVAMDSVYYMDVRLNKGLTTSNGSTIPPQPQLFGIAEVLTSDKNMLQRLFEKMWVKYRR